MPSERVRVWSSNHLGTSRVTVERAGAVPITLMSRTLTTSPSCGKSTVNPGCWVGAGDGSGAAIDGGGIDAGIEGEDGGAGPAPDVADVAGGGVRAACSTGVASDVPLVAGFVAVLTAAGGPPTMIQPMSSPPTTTASPPKIQPPRGDRAGGFRRGSPRGTVPVARSRAGPPCRDAGAAISRFTGSGAYAPGPRGSPPRAYAPVMSRPTVPYGAWPSPFSVEMAVAGSRSLREPWFDGDDLYWLESRPDEGGRIVIVRRAPDGRISDLTPPELNARTRVHEYGGGSYTVDDGLVVFSNFADGRLYRQTATGRPEALTPADALRYADLRIDRARGRVLCVVEDHRAGDSDPINTIGAVSLADGSLTTLVSGSDFFSDPRLDADGERLAWLRWDRPDMPWDGCELWVGRITADGSVSEARVVAGSRDESIVQPEWQSDGSLVFASDRSGWWNLYRWREAAADLLPLAPMDAEFAGPQWVFGFSYFAGLSDGRLVAVARVQGPGSPVCAGRRHRPA